MRKILILAVFFLVPSFGQGRQRDSAALPQWKIPEKAPLLTKWSRDVIPNNVLPEYPRPQMVRQKWMNLNGVWEYAERIGGQTPPTGSPLGGHILVPFPIESALSGVMKNAEGLWYRRTFTLPEEWNDQHILLHFGAVDWEASILMNGKEIGSHRGGYAPFSFDITSALKKKGEQELVVGVFDPSDGGDQPRGKQVRKPSGIWYTPTTGIWQTVWLEPVPANHIEGIDIVPDVDAKQLVVRSRIQSAAKDDLLRIEVRDGKQTIATAESAIGSEARIGIKEPKLWSPANPFLYDIVVKLIRMGRAVDSVTSYSGMRKIAVAKDANGINRMMLNGEFVFQVGPLDQGFWPDGIYTAPTDDALKFDIEMTRKLGFNMTRKHVKVEPERWYYWADKLGLLVWQDMPSANNSTPESKVQFESELRQLIETHRNHPSIIMWVVFNEGWGQYDTERLTSWVRELDPTRLVNNASGWTDKNAGDVLDVHNYPKPLAPKPDPARAIVLGEFGGLGLAIPNHTWKKEHWGYQGMSDNAQLTSKYESFMKRVYELKDNPGLSAAIYTQITDVEVECNGLLTYDRAIVKPDLDRIAAVNQGDWSRMPPRPTVKVVVPSSEEEGRLWRYTLNEPGPDWFKVDFIDSSWIPGQGGFGTEGTPGAIVRTTWNTGNIWLRSTVEVRDKPSASLHLRLHHDEDAVVYINGVLAGTYSGYSSEYEEYPLKPEGLAAIKSGRNVIAVSCRQTGGGQYIDLGIVDIIPREHGK